MASQKQSRAKLRSVELCVGAMKLLAQRTEGNGDALVVKERNKRAGQEEVDATESNSSDIFYAFLPAA